MISVEEAQRRVVAAFTQTAAETVDLVHLTERVLADDVSAKTSQPPFPVSAMDGYAVRKTDGDAPRTVIGTAPAGHPFEGTLGKNQAIRIFTGGVVPFGADAIVIQEEVDRTGDVIYFNANAVRPDFIRTVGLDFKTGDVLAAAGKRITARDVALLAAADVTEAAVRSRPRVAIASIGDELSRPGEPRRPGGIVASTGYGLMSMVAAWGGAPVDLGILPDSAEEIATIARAEADLIVTLGGASVGDHDLVQKALGTTNFELDFWKVAMRPGKPLIFGRLGATPLFGMPGNPVSALVCALLFLRPAIAAMLGVTEYLSGAMTARLKQPLAANDSRRSYLRARLTREDGELWAEPFAVQDSSMLSILANADALIVRAPDSGTAEIGDRVEIISLDQS